MDDDETGTTTGVEASPELAALFAAHPNFSGTHSHSHSAYGQQGGDDAHDHSHTHEGDNRHRHDHAATGAAPVAAAGPQAARDAGATFGDWLAQAADVDRAAFRADPPAGAESWWSGVVKGLAFVAGAGPDSDPMLGARWAVKQTGPAEYVVVASGLTAASGPTPWSTETSYGAALDVIAAQLASDGDTRSTLADGWQSEMAYEGVATGDGRFIDPGAIGFRAAPLPLMLQTETEVGHMGAVLAGAITQTGMLGQTALGLGDYDATDAGRQAYGIVDSRSRFGVSIDVAEADGYPHCDTHNIDPRDEGAPCDWDCDITMHFTTCRVMGLTMTPFPAFEDAYISNRAAAAPADGAAQQIAVAASASTDGPAAGCAECAQQMAEGVAAAGGAPVVASAGPAPDIAAPAAWFADPGFAIGDGRLVRQPNGHYACPLTVDPPDEQGRRRVYGHMASWFSCHTGIRDRCVTPPRSKTGYAAFNLRPIPTEDGDLVKVGHLTMGIGHADIDPGLSYSEVTAHYDGGPGAVRMAWVHMGEDEFGPWFAGTIAPGVTDEQVSVFQSCSVSGDWREVWRGKGLDCVACLAGVTVPGFPIAAAGIGFPTPDSDTMRASLGRRPEVRIGWRADDPVSIVAAGAIAQPAPWERMIAAQQGIIDALTATVARLELTINPLRPIAAAALRDRI